MARQGMFDGGSGMVELPGCPFDKIMLDFGIDERPDVTKNKGEWIKGMNKGE